MSISISNTSLNNTSKAVLSINLSSIEANYRLLCGMLVNSRASAVIKADGYGLGSEKIAPALFNAGCRTFFVAHIDEALEVRKAVPSGQICVLNGLDVKTEEIYKKYSILPVLGSIREVVMWRKFCSGEKLPCCLHIDTGMLRLGVSTDDLNQLLRNPSGIKDLNIKYLISHLSSADDAQSPENELQLSLFKKIRKTLSVGQASLAASSGIFLGKNYHFDLVRPGIAIYGGNPTPKATNPMLPVISLMAQIKQIRTAYPNQKIGYGATYKVKSLSRIATLAVGYADGFLRSLSSKGFCNINGFDAPIVGRVSMDLITLDVSKIPEEFAFEGQWVELIGQTRTIDMVAQEAGTIGHEILTSLGTRYNRIYTNEEFTNEPIQS